jgi:hypothetical protein
LERVHPLWRNIIATPNAKRRQRQPPAHQRYVPSLGYRRDRATAIAKPRVSERAVSPVPACELPAAFAEGALPAPGRCANAACRLIRPAKRHQGHPDSSLIRRSFPAASSQRVTPVPGNRTAPDRNIPAHAPIHFAHRSMRPLFKSRPRPNLLSEQPGNQAIIRARRQLQQRSPADAPLPPRASVELKGSRCTCLSGADRSSPASGHLRWGPRPQAAD